VWTHVVSLIRPEALLFHIISPYQDVQNNVYLNTVSCKDNLTKMLGVGRSGALSNIIHAVETRVKPLLKDFTFTE